MGISDSDPPKFFITLIEFLEDNFQRVPQSHPCGDPRCIRASCLEGPFTTLGLDEAGFNRRYSSSTLILVDA